MKKARTVTKTGVREFERKVKGFLRHYNKQLNSLDDLPESVVYDYDHLMEGLSRIVKTITRLERVSARLRRKSR